MNAATQSNNPSEYFNLHAQGIGYVNNIRLVTVNGKGKKAQPFLACRIAAMRGEAGDVQYTHFDLRVSGEEAKAVMESLRKAVDGKQANGDRNKVIVRFRLGDFYAEAFEYQTGERKGQVGAAIKGRLLKVFSARVNGELVYQAPKNSQEESSSAVPTAPQPAMQKTANVINGDFVHVQDEDEDNIPY